MNFWYSIPCITCLILSPQVALAVRTADAIYLNGTILTINDSEPTAEAVAVKDGNTLSVGKESEVIKTVGENTKKTDLGGKTMLPGFVDSHGHAHMTGLQAATANLLTPPDGAGKDIVSLQALLADWARNNEEAGKKVGWIAGFGYDDSQLAGFVILSDNPLTVPRGQLDELRVLETMKEGKSIYKRPAEGAVLSSPAVFGLAIHEGHDPDDIIPGVKPVHGDGCFNHGLLRHALSSVRESASGVPNP